MLLQHGRDRLTLIIEDDGTGFENGRVSGDLTKRSGLGLVGMRERAALLKGTLEIDTQPGGGTTIIVQIPLS